MATPFTATLETGRLDADFSRIDIEFLGVDHAGSYYEGRVYLNNPAADASTGRAAAAGYVGSYYVFGHGGCLGEAHHRDVRARRIFDPRPGHHLTGARKVVIAAERVAQKALAAGEQVTVTVVPPGHRGWPGERLGRRGAQVRHGEDRHLPRRGHRPGAGGPRSTRPSERRPQPPAAASPIGQLTPVPPSPQYPPGCLWRYCWWYSSA